MPATKQVPEDERQGDPIYAAMVESIDESVGRVLATLEELSLEEKTVVIFTSDNGGFYKATSNAPLRANKGAYYEGGIRVPLIIKWPGVTRPGTRHRRAGDQQRPVSHLPGRRRATARPNQHRDGLNLQAAARGREIRSTAKPSSGTSRITTSIRPPCRRA